VPQTRTKVRHGHCAQGCELVVEGSSRWWGRWRGEKRVEVEVEVEGSTPSANPFGGKRLSVPSSVPRAIPESKPFFSRMSLVTALSFVKKYGVRRPHY
jgi:hypothetical protein